MPLRQEAKLLLIPFLQKAQLPKSLLCRGLCQLPLIPLLLEIQLPIIPLQLEAQLPLIPLPEEAQLSLVPLSQEAQLLLVPLPQEAQLPPPPLERPAPGGATVTTAPSGPRQMESGTVSSSQGADRSRILSRHGVKK